MAYNECTVRDEGLEPCEERMPRRPERQADMASLHAMFEALLPRLVRHLRFAFRHCRAEAHDEAIQEGVAAAWASFIRLAERGIDASAFVSKLARFAVLQVRNDRRIGTRYSCRDVYSRRGQRMGSFRLLGLRHPIIGWREMLVEDRSTTPADTAAIRIDFQAWLATLPLRTRGIAAMLALAHSTAETARRFRLSPARISQLRRELEGSWIAFQANQRDIPRSAGEC